MENYSNTSILITGGNRGLGLELVRQLTSRQDHPKDLFVTCRKLENATELKELSSKVNWIHLYEFDVVDFDSYPRLVSWVEEKLGGRGLNVLINNAGLKSDVNDLSEITPDAVMREFKTNTLGPLFISKAFLPLLKKAATLSGRSGMSVYKSAIINMSTMMASISENTGGGEYPYRISKTGLNMATKSLAVDLKADGVLAVALHPGWVLTDMGGPNALIDKETSVKGMLTVLTQLTENDTGTFIKYNGDRLPW